MAEAKSEPTGYQIRLKDRAENGEHGDAFFSLSSDFDFAQSRGKTVDELVDGLMAELFEEHNGGDYDGLWPAWAELKMLPSGIRLPDAPLAHRRELKAFLEIHYGEACCIGWID